MFDISALKEMKLSELQDIAKAAKTIKFHGVKKEELIQSILDTQSSSSKPDEMTADENGPKSKRARIIPVKIKPTPENTLFSKPEPVEITNEEPAPAVVAEVEILSEKVEERPVKFQKAKFEKKNFKKQVDNPVEIIQGEASEKVESSDEVPSNEEQPQRQPNQPFSKHNNGNGNGNNNPNFKNKKTTDFYEVYSFLFSLFIQFFFFISTNKIKNRRSPFSKDELWRFM